MDPAGIKIAPGPIAKTAVFKMDGDNLESRGLFHVAEVKGFVTKIWEWIRETKVAPKQVHDKIQWAIDDAYNKATTYGDQCVFAWREVDAIYLASSNPQALPDGASPLDILQFWQAMEEFADSITRSRGELEFVRLVRAKAALLSHTVRISLPIKEYRLHFVPARHICPP